MFYRKGRYTTPADLTITVVGLDIPPDQKVSQIRSTWDFNAPVIMVFSVMERLEIVGGGGMLMDMGRLVRSSLRRID